MYLRERSMFEDYFLPLPRWPGELYWTYSLILVTDPCYVQGREQYLDVDPLKGRPACRKYNPVVDNVVRRHRIAQRATMTGNQKPSAATLTASQRIINEKEYWGIVYHLLSSWTAASVRTAAFLAMQSLL